MRRLDRRSFLLAGAGASAATLAGCSAEEDRPTVPTDDVNDQVPSTDGGPDGSGPPDPDGGDPFAADVPTNPVRPLVMTNHVAQALQGTMGWEDRPARAAREVLRLDPDLYNELDLSGWRGPPKTTSIASRHQAVSSLAYRNDRPYSLGVHYTIRANLLHEHWYRNLPADRKWRRPDGSLVEHPRELAAQSFAGEDHLGEAGDRAVVRVASIFADGTRDRLVRTGREMFGFGATQFWIDSHVGGLDQGLDFSEWAQAAWRDHLASLPSERLADFGIDDPASFDIRRHLSENGLAPDDVDVPAVDPVYREYARFQHETNKRFMAEVFEGARDDLPPAIEESGTTVFGLGFGLQLPFLDPADIYAGDVVDDVSVETRPTVPPNRPHDVAVKIARAAGRFEKPVRVWGRMNRKFRTTFGFDPTESYPTLNRFHVAQAYAHGGSRSIPLTSLPDVHEHDSVNSWIEPDGSIPDELHRFAGFVRAHRRFLSDVTEANAAAVLVSLPTQIWRHAMEWGTRRTDHAFAVSGVAATLRRAHVPYDVQILDYPPLWEAPDQSADLDEYDLVVLPGVECVSDAHLAGIESALSAGTTVVATGGAPGRTEQYEPREDVARVLRESPNGTIIDENPAVTDPGAAAATLTDAIPAGRQLELGIDGDVSTNVFTQSTPTRAIIHLVNFAYDRSADTMREWDGVELRLRNLPVSPDYARYFTEAGAETLPIEGSAQELEVTIPALDVWGILVLAETEEAVVSATDEATAASAIDDCGTAIEDARDAQRTVGLDQATATLAGAEQEHAYGAYAEATQTAANATAWARRAHRRPVVGIDGAQPGQSATGLQSIRDAVGEYRFVDVTAWDEDELGEVDVFLIATGEHMEQTDFDLSPADLDALEGFVESGGSLLLLGRHGMDEDVNRIAGRFGLEYEYRPVYRDGEGDPWAFYVESPLTSITHSVPDWRARFGVTFAETGDARVLGRVASRQEATLGAGNGGPDATGRPVLAGLRRGDGVVLASGEAEQFYGPEDGPSVLVRNILRTLGRKARHRRRPPVA